MILISPNSRKNVWSAKRPILQASVDWWEPTTQTTKLIIFKFANNTNGIIE